jgi:hypothetical protein
VRQLKVSDDYFQHLRHRLQRLPQIATNPPASHH